MMRFNIIVRWTSSVVKNEKIVRWASSLVRKENVHERIVTSFPMEGMEMAFAYGSGVFQQEGHVDMSKNMLDYIFVVDNPKKWHQQNMKLYPKHYSFLRYFGAKRVAKIQNNYGAGVYFNTLVHHEDRLIKYGVISTDRLITDLLDWDTLYVSGRLHKPVKLVVLPTNKQLLSAMHINLQSAMHAALLLLPESFTEEELYTQITNLSYAGDFRMQFGEDKNKVSNIVKPNIPYFKRLYEKIIESEKQVIWHKNDGFLEQYPTHISQFHHLNLLPKTVQVNIVEIRRLSGSSGLPDMEEVIRNMAHESHCDDYVAQSLKKIVKTSSWSQSIKSVFTAGVTKSFKYSMKKVKKMLKRTKQK
jgi:translocator assembly and maintenance protein 41